MMEKQKSHNKESVTLRKPEPGTQGKQKVNNRDPVKGSRWIWVVKHGPKQKRLVLGNVKGSW